MCGNTAEYTSEQGSIRVVDSVPPLTLCVWVIDMRLEVNLAVDYLDLNVTLGGSDTQPTGRCTVNGYRLAASSATPDLVALQPSTKILDSLISSRHSISQSLHSNYLLISYWTPDNHDLSAGLSITWAVVSPSSTSHSNTTTIIITIVTVGTAICSACCLYGAYRLSKARRRRRIYLDRTELALIYQTSNRRLYSHYSGVSLSSLYLMEGNYDQIMPKTPFQPELLEVGAAVCSICLEE